MNKFYLIDTLGDTNDDDIVCIEDYVRGLEMDDWRTGFGHASSDAWPVDAAIYLRKTSGSKLTDLLGTITNTLYASPRFRQVIEKHCAGVEIEYLPFSLYDHRKRLLSKEYVIVNPIGTLDCLDTEASDVLWDDDDPNKALAVSGIVLSAKKLSKIERVPALFRLKEDRATYIMNYDLATDIYGGDYKNIFWEKLEVKGSFPKENSLPR
jgi:hypothetical protein